MKRSSARLRAAFALVVAVGVAVLGAVAWTTHEQSARLDETAGWADRTRASVAAVQAVSRAVVDAEAAQRGYLLGSPTALARYQEAVADAKRNLDIIAPAIGDDPEQAQLLSGLRMAVETHLERLDKAVALTPTQPEQARAIALDARGAQSRRDIQSFADAMAATEGQRFDEQVVASREVRHAVEIDAGVMLALLVALMTGGALYILRELKVRAAMTAALVESRTRLELGERRLRAIADNVPACIAYVDRTETYRFTNAAFKTLFDVPHDAFIGHTVTEMMGEARRDELAPYITQALAGHAVHFERKGMGQQPDAQLLVSYVPDFNAQGGVDGYYVMSLDISARKRAELELANSERRLRTITDNLPATIVRMDTNLVCTYANEQMRRLYGIDPALMVGMSHRAFRGEEEWAQVGPHVAAALRGEVRRFEVPALVNGRQQWVQQHVIPDVDAEGRIVGYLSVTFDITERKLQEEELRKSELFLDRTGRMAGVGGWEVDLVTGAVVWSRETRRIHGVDADYVPDLPTAFQFYPPEARQTIEAAVRGAMTEGTPWDMELPFVRADGRRIWVRAVGSAEFASGAPVRLVGAFQDISDKVAQRLEIKQVNDRIALATESGGIGIWELDIATGELIWDARMFQLFGDTSGGRASPVTLWDQRVHPEDLPGLQRAMRDATQGARLLDRDYRIVLEDGRTRHLRGTARVMRDADDRPLRLIGAAWDITELRELAANLAEDRSLLSVTLESIGDAVITTDAHGQITWLNPVAERLTGWTSAEAGGRALTQVFHIVDENTREPSPDPVQACLEQGRRVAGSASTLLLSRNGDEFGIEDSIAPIRREDGTVLGTVLVFHDVSEQRRLTGEMSWRATHDALTGLVNRAEFEARMGRLLQSAHEHGGEHALLYIDLDQFKLVNDACGHAVGDQLLQQMARMLTDSVRTRDTVARLGGDEFAILMERCSVEQALPVAQKLCDRMDDFRFVHEERRFRIGLSIGLVPVDRRWQGTAAIQQAADTACYAAKEAGRNRVHTWFDTDLAMRERQFEAQWVTRIEHALDEDGFVLYAQRLAPLKGEPAADARVYAEVLLRMRQDDGPLVAPGAFLPAAERFHLASRIDRWVLRHVVDWMAALAEPARIGLLSVNLSGQSVGDRAFHRWALELLAKAGPRLCGALCLEITETAAVTNIADAAAFIDEVREHGVKVALDDFGAGAASFGYLKTLRVDTLKIDGQFVRDLVDDPLDEVAVRCFADVAKVMGLSTVAEFVDKPAVLERLHAMGVDFAQGFLLHEPAPIDELLQPAPQPA
jgi:diguanylate cyclase (GGDEF)-like protein/PAS domain S-box-containing protein